MKQQTIIKILAGLIISVILFHLAIMFKLLPSGVTWGGNLQNDTEMYFLEAVSIFVNLILGIVVLMKGNYLKSALTGKTIDIILKVFITMFLLNTFGNLFATTNFEKCFAVLTLAFAVLILLLLKSKNATLTPDGKND